MEERELRDLETIFAQVEDPRMERTKLHRLRDIIITGDLWSDLRSRRMGRDRRIWEGEGSLVHGIAEPAQWDPLA